jgi:ABC-type lipoprotein export system ATPase subunit
MLYKLQGVAKGFGAGESEVKALRGVDLTVAAGEFVALVGPSGSGKSTLLNVLGLLEVPTGGRVEFAGVDVGAATETVRTRLRCDAIGFIFQSFNLIPVLSAVENVEYALLLQQKLTPREARKEAMAMLERVGLTEQAHRRPAHLSGGQRQRVAIARALVKRPRVVLADEPTANLDSGTSGQVMATIAELQREHGTAFLVATHDRDLASAAPRRIHVRDGAVVGDEGRHVAAA